MLDSVVPEPSLSPSEIHKNHGTAEIISLQGVGFKPLSPTPLYIRKPLRKES